MTGPNITNTLSQPAELTRESLDNALEALRRYTPPPLDHFKAGTAYWEHLKILQPLPQPPKGMIGGYMGVNIFVDDTLPPDVMEARDKDGKVLQTFKLEPSDV